MGYVTKKEVLRVLYDEYWRHVLAFAKAKAEGKEGLLMKAPWATELNTAYDLILKPNDRRSTLKATYCVEHLQRYAEFLLEDFPKKIQAEEFDKDQANRIYGTIIVAGKYIAKKYNVSSQFVTG